MCEAAEVCGITDVLLIGDTHDVFGLSTHSKPSKRLFSMGRLQDEIAAAKPFLAWCSRFRTATYLEGNHEARLRRLSEWYPALDGLGWAEMLRLNDHAHFDVMDEDTVVRVGPACIEHGHHLKGSLTRTPAKSVLANYPDQFTIFGHNHRMDYAWRTKPKYVHGKLYAAACVGHMSETAAQFYASRPDWQTGFGVLDVWQDGLGHDRVSLELVPIHYDRRGNPSFKMPGFGKVFR